MTSIAFPFTVDPQNHLTLKMPCMKSEGIASYPGEHSIEDLRPFTGVCWLLISLCMGDSSFEDSTQRVSVIRKGGDVQGASEDKLPPPACSYHFRL